MNSYIHHATENTPEIILSPNENKFEIKGKSAPEDVRGLYYPVVKWMISFVAWVRENNPYTDGRPLVLKINLEYFNSSSAKFLFDIFNQLKGLNKDGIPVIIEWHYDAEDTDLLEAGEDLAMLCEIEFNYCPNTEGTK
jgi:hypothetical protein